MIHRELTVVVGLGVSGLACVRYLVAQGIDVAVVDSRQQPPALAEFLRDFPDVPYALGSYHASFLHEAQQLILSPGISLQEPAIAEQAARGVSIIGDIELFVRQAQAPIVAITGSNGKTTVTTLMGEMITAAGFCVGVGGNIGEPALNLLAKPADYYVLELSSFQLETTFSLQAAAAVILNITADHMDRYSDFQSYCAAKQRIYQHCQRPVVNLDQAEIWQPLALGAPLISFGFDSADVSVVNYQNEDYIAIDQQPVLAIRELPMRQQHHIQNALAALALGVGIGLPLPPMLEVLRQFRGLPHRCQLVGEYVGVTWYNDSKGTNVGATIAAILSLGRQKTGRLVLIVGGDSKCADLWPLHQPATQYVDELILLGKDAPLFYELLHQQLTCTSVDSMEAAVKYAAESTQAGDIVLLSPACASFDMFNNYEHRGNIFMQCVRELYA